MNTTKRLARFPEYVFSRLNNKILEIEKISGRKVMNFGIGSPDFRPSEIYIKAYENFLEEPISHMYPGYKAIPEFAEALQQWYKKRFNVTLHADELLPLLGAKDGVSHLPLALMDDEDELLVPDPGYPAFSGSALMFGMKPIFYSLKADTDFRIDFTELKSKITTKTKCIWVNFPSNPTGQIATMNDLEKLVAMAQENNIIIMYDNAYSEIAFDNYIAPSILQIPGARNTAIEIGSFSKSFSFAGFRMGWIVGSKDVIASLGKVKSQLDSGLSLPLQKLGAYALTHMDTEWHTAMITSYNERRNIIASKLKKLHLRFSIPKGGLYIWAQIPDTEKNSEDYCLRMLSDKQVFFAPGSAFGKNGERYIRVSICVNIEDIDNYL